MASISLRSIPDIVTTWSIIGSKVCECVCLLLTVNSATIVSSANTAADATNPELSIANNFTANLLLCPSPVCVGNQTLYPTLW